jgi:hypothetical protein
MKRLWHTVKAQLVQLAYAMALPAYTYWGYCTVCGKTTPWRAEAMRGHYECLCCGTNPLSAEQEKTLVGA